MLSITIRTDKPQAEIGLYEDEKQLAYETWPAHRQLAETIHLKLKSLLESQSKDLHEVAGVVVFQGPGSFTGLRIGITVANTLAYSLGAKIVASGEPDWLAAGLKRLQAGESDPVALPAYGAAPHITQQKK